MEYIYMLLLYLFMFCCSLQSVSDDSVDLGSSSKRPSVLDSLGQAPQQQQEKKSQRSVPWWQEDEDSDETPGKGRLSIVFFGIEVTF